MIVWLKLTKLTIQVKVTLIDIRRSSKMTIVKVKVKCRDQGEPSRYVEIKVNHPGMELRASASEAHCGEGLGRRSRSWSKYKSACAPPKKLGQSPHLEVEVVRSLGVKPVPELENNLMEDGRVDLFAQLHQDEPVPEAELLHHDGDVAPIGTFGTSTEDEVARVLREDCNQPETEVLFFCLFF